MKAHRFPAVTRGKANDLADGRLRQRCGKRSQPGHPIQALLVRQIVGATQLGRAAAEAYARRKGVTTEAFLAGFGKPLSPSGYGEHVVTLLTAPQYESPPAFGIRGETGIQPLDT